MKRALSLVLAVVMVFSLALGVVAADTARAALADSGTDSGPVDSGGVYHHVHSELWDSACFKDRRDGRRGKGHVPVYRGRAGARRLYVRRLV